ncbi:hypothetical protein BDV36DRAFT_263466 [Aspergillus pseudocaelatus]|uniref:Secreted protein n=1 Tax=Aspergillus pseudocaelatus TaxID=1825620 RepID=A0ABQ6WG80_9EURO|nr:hypothetical protein BDV36DRAFT_263466 [Aspergillus pseudocaelatus]
MTRLFVTFCFQVCLAAFPRNSQACSRSCKISKKPRIILSVALFISLQLLTDDYLHEGSPYMSRRTGPRVNSIFVWAMKYHKSFYPHHVGYQDPVQIEIQSDIRYLWRV